MIARHRRCTSVVRGIAERRLPERLARRSQVELLHLVDVHLPGRANAFQNGLDRRHRTMQPGVPGRRRPRASRSTAGTTPRRAVANALRAGQRLPRAGTRLVVPPLEHSKACQVGQQDAVDQTSPCFRSRAITSSNRWLASSNRPACKAL